MFIVKFAAVIECQGKRRGGGEREKGKVYSAIWEMLNTYAVTHTHTQSQKKKRKKKRWIENVRI